MIEFSKSMQFVSSVLQRDSHRYVILILFQVYIHVLWGSKGIRRWTVWVWHQVLGATWPYSTENCSTAKGTGNVIYWDSPS